MAGARAGAQLLQRVQGLLGRHQLRGTGAGDGVHLVQRLQLDAAVAHTLDAGQALAALRLHAQHKPGGKTHDFRLAQAKCLAHADGGFLGAVDFAAAFEDCLRGQRRGAQGQLCLLHLLAPFPRYDTTKRGYGKEKQPMVACADACVFGILPHKR